MSVPNVLKYGAEYAGSLPFISWRFDPLPNVRNTKEYVAVHLTKGKTLTGAYAAFYGARRDSVCAAYGDVVAWLPITETVVTAWLERKEANA